ncbi:hypothetical protein QOZ80_6AG0509260 [Eleusine coracana subsp. coracana]|nr:hypothetical protein QOZ80_6AG0509260 [Eleusine coracana subsp. coracana]
MPRHRARRPAQLGDRDLAAEVLYLHSLWHRGPPSPAPAPAPAAAAAPNQSRSGRRRPRKRNRRRLGRGDDEIEDGGPDWSLAPSPPEESTPPSPGSPAHPAADEETISNRDPARSRSARRKPNKRRRRGMEHDAAETQDPWSERPLAQASPDGPTSSNPPPPPSPGSLAHREAIRTTEEFFATHISDVEEEEEEVSESEGDEEEAVGFFTEMFERDVALRGHYERHWEEGQFACMACVGRKARRGKGRRFRGCVGLVQHARAATRYGRPAAHRALAAVVCRVLGWDIERLPNIVIDPRGTLGQALAARAQSDGQEAKEDVDTEMGGSNANGDEADNELVTSKESSGMKDVEEIVPLNCEDSSKNNVHGHETYQEVDAVKTGMEEPLCIDGEKGATELNGDKESSEKDNANKDNSLSQGNNGVVHEQDIAIESTEKENTKDTCSKDECKNEQNCMKASVQEEVNATVSEPEHTKTADDMGDTAVARLENNPTEENVDDDKEHANSIVKFYEELEGEDIFTS